MIETTDADALVAFAAVVETGNFSAAARKLKSTRQSVHRRVVRLEEHAGIRLLERSTRHTRPTIAGSLVYEHAVVVREALAAAAKTATSMRSEPAGQLKISAPPLLVECILPPFFIEFSSLFPKICLEVLSEARRADLLLERVDLSLRLGELESSSLKSTRLTSFPKVWVASASHTEYLRLKSPLELEELPFIQYGCTPVRQIIAQVEGQGEGHEEVEFVLRPKMISNSGSLVRQAVRAGLGFALLPEFYVADAIGSGELIQFFPNVHTPPISLHAVFTSPSKGNLALSALLELLKRHLS